MRKVTIFSILTMLALTMLLSSCSGNSNSNSNILYEYRTGTYGLELEFTPNSPPYIVYAEDQSFPVTVEIKNKGVFPGEGDGALNAVLYYLGFDKDIIGNLVSEPITFDEEEAKTRFNAEGGFTVVSSEATIDPNFFQEAKIDTYDANIKAVLCYPYKTFASVDVCIDPNPNRDSSLDSCTPGLVSSGSQGAPVAVSSVDSISQKGKARFVVTITNVGNGAVIKESELGRCIDVELDREDIDKITIVDAKLSNGIPLDCTPDGDVSLVGNKATIICKAEGLDESMPAFQTVLQMELTYGYKKSIDRRIQIQGE
ncbi:hypothetical protein H6503_01600 [Candidatus Woesearchaeota archaeon]|nr:hypothetical protein [Candidatus Woesearchaeota archaeon]